MEIINVNAIKKGWFFMLVIEKNIPIAAQASHAGRPRKYPCREMKIGDSFLIPLGEIRYGTVIQICNYWNQRLRPKRFVYRTLIDGYRVWRKKW